MPANTDAALSAEELQRYHRHLILPQIGDAGQRRLKAARVLVVGAGGLGSPVVLYLAAAGVGHIGLVDEDVVELSNLQRQVMHSTRTIGQPKVSSARSAVRELNPGVRVETFHTRLTSANALEIIRGFDVVVDGTDNFPTRYLINDACILLQKPNVYGSVLRFDGQASVFAAGGAPCYRCLFREPPPAGSVPNCAEGGVLGVLPGLVGMIQATETIKLLTGAGDTLVGRLLLIDALRMQFRTIELAGDPACPACGTREIQALQDYDAFCGIAGGSSDSPSGAPDVDGPDEDSHDITPRQLDALLKGGAAISIIDVREPYEWSVARIPAARLVPLNSLPGAVHSLDREGDIVVYCHHGMRSAAAMDWLRDQGFERVRNLVGGIDRWSLEVDPSVRRY